MFGYIYLTENQINHKKYIGKKVSDHFLGTAYLGSGTYLKNAVAKYGKENFTVSLIEECQSSEELDQREVLYIQKYNAVESDEFYNLANGVRGNTSGTKRSDEWISKLSAAATGRQHSAETRAKLSQIVSSTIWIYNAETDDQQKINAAEFDSYHTQGYERGRRPLSEAHRKALSRAHTGKKRHFSISGYNVLKNNHNTAGRIWVTNGIVNHLVKVQDVEEFQKSGFHKGMTRSSTTIERVAN